MTLSGKHIEVMLIEELCNRKCIRSEHITDRAALEANFRRHSQEQSRVNLTDLHISQHVGTDQAEEEVDFAAAHAELVRIEEGIRKNRRMNADRQ